MKYFVVADALVVMVVVVVVVVVVAIIVLERLLSFSVAKCISFAIQIIEFLIVYVLLSQVYDENHNCYGLHNL